MFLMFAVILSGAGAMSVAWMIARPLMQASERVAVHDLPLGWRLCWPWLTALSAVCGSCLSWRQRDCLDAVLKQAGLPAAVTPVHFIASIASLALLGATMTAGLAAALNWSGALGGPALAGGLGGGFWLISRVLVRIRRRRRDIDRALPFVLDMMTLCVESGLSLYSALQHTEHHAPPGVLHDELAHMLADMRAGMPRSAALQAMANRCDCPSVTHWVAALIQADGLGMSLGTSLREHAVQCRARRFQVAEKMAMQAPVKMLLPLIGCIFPCTFIVLGFPVVMQLWEVAP